MQMAKWMWADASLIANPIGHNVAKINPLRWSRTKSIEDTLNELENIKTARPEKAGRPVTVQFQPDSQAPHQMKTELEKVYHNVESAISGLREHLHACTAFQSASTEEPLLQDDCTSESAGSVVRVPLQALRSHLTRESTVVARWMSDNVELTIGLTKVVPVYRQLSTRNPFRWSEWCSLEETIESLRSYSDGDCKEQPVNLQVSVKSPEHGEVKYRTAAANAATTIAALEDLRDMLTKDEEETSPFMEILRDRADFIAEVGQEKAEDSYQNYTSSVMQENGGYIGAVVQFSSDEPHPFIRDGQKGIIQRFDHINSFTVNWGVHSASVGMLQCTVLATADRRLHLADVSADDVLASLMSLVNAHLKKLSANPRQIEGFERACKRCVQVYTDPSIGHYAAKSGMCDTLVEAMTRDKDQKGGPTESVQSAGCLMLWWITRFSGGHNHCGAGSEERHREALQALKTEVVKANSFSALVEARKAFPQNHDLVRAASDVVAFLIEDCQQFYNLALDAGWRCDWLSK
mmetsp:Transcript_36511/g.66549  ORF Transcript_36511/g.66549 Transcript_36511/m.66549 type:complete len:521 (+) Transcript_36511:96-1658(+)